MKFATRLAFVLFLCPFLIQCGNQPPEREELAKEVMIIHDEAMPKMQNIIDLKMQLQEMRNELTADTLQQHDAQLEKMRQAIKQLNSADEAMMDWMAEYQKTDIDRLTDEEAVAFLKKEKERITEVQRLMEQSIEESEKLLEELQNPDRL